MKKLRRIALLATATAMLLAACNSGAGRSVDSGEIVVPEMSSEDLIVSSLEYLLQEEELAEEAEESLEEEPQDVEEDKNGAQLAQPRQEYEPEENEAVIYYGHAGSYDLKREVIQLEEKTAEELLDALSKQNIVSLDTKVLSF